MTDLSCYKIRPGLAGPALDGLDALVEMTKPLRVSNRVLTGDFEARLYVQEKSAQPVNWANFVQAGFADAIIGPAVGPSALLIIRLIGPDDHGEEIFAFAFGSSGRHLLKPDSYRRGFGLRTALNLIYPSTKATDSSLRSIDTKRRGPTTTRTRVQASEQTTFETFDVNRLRDLLNKVVGTPHDKALWGIRVTGSDSLNFSVPDSFEDIGERCRHLGLAYEQTDYKAQFDWIDQVRPITDPNVINELNAQILNLLSLAGQSGLSLAPPEIVDWDKVAKFRYHFDRPQGKAREYVTHSDMRLVDYLSGLLRGHGNFDGLSVEKLRSNRIFALNGDGGEVEAWSVWKCLVGEFELNGATYILDEGDFYEVRADFLSELNAVISGLPLASVQLPTSTPSEWEGDYNIRAANSPCMLLLDKNTVKITTSTTAIEICDLLTTERQLIHVKRHLGSSDLSHLFSQGVVSACLLQESPEFRKVAITKIAEVSAGAAGWEFIDPATLTPGNFEIVYAIAERWQGRSFTQALPFFSKINLREAVNNLRGRGFRVSLYQIAC